MKRLRSQRGQSTIEFALVLILLVTFTFFFIQLALVLGYGNYVQYATFMSARTLLSAGYETEQEEKAKEVLIQMLKRSIGQPGIDRWPGIARGEGGNEIKGALIGDGPQFSTQPWMQGVRYTFRSRLFMIPLGGNSSTNSITLTSESWLGKEPSYTECVSSLQGVLFDNGC